VLVRWPPPRLLPCVGRFAQPPLGLALLALLVQQAPPAWTSRPGARRLPLVPLPDGSVCIAMLVQRVSPAGIASPLSGRAYPSLSDPSAWPGPSSGHGGGCFLLCRSARVLIPSRSADRRGGREYSAGRMGVVLPALLAPAIPTARLTGSHHNRWLNADRRISMRSRNALFGRIG
jgi:hypothetical protein